MGKRSPWRRHERIAERHLNYRAAGAALDRAAERIRAQDAELAELAQRRVRYALALAEQDRIDARLRTERERRELFTELQRFAEHVEHLGGAAGERPAAGRRNRKQRPKPKITPKKA